MTQDEKWNIYGSWFFDERSGKVDDMVKGLGLLLVHGSLT